MRAPRSGAQSVYLPPMQLGFVTAILPDLPFRQVVDHAAELGYDCLEVMCWPAGEGAKRRYAGVVHLDVARPARELRDELDYARERGIGVSALGYYPNPLDPDRAAARAAVEHLERLIDAAAELGVGTVTAFVGRDRTRTIEAQWDDFLATWRPLVARAEAAGVRVGIENCPMRFTADEWPGGNNLAVGPAVWERMWADLPYAGFGLNYDPSHLVLMHMDESLPLRDYPGRLVHVHAKDLRIDRAARDRHGVWAHPKLWHTPKLPGLGDVDWGRFFGHLTDAGYAGAVCVEVEDRAYEHSLARRLASLRQSRAYLQQYFS